MRAISVFTLLLLASLAAFAQDDPLAAGLERFRDGEYLAAEKLFRQALDSGAGPRARVFLALTWAATNRCEEAEPELRKALEEQPEGTLHRLAGLGLARCRIAAEGFADAVAVLDRLREAYPDDADVLYESARVHLKAWNGVVEEMFEKVPSSFRVNQLSAEIFEIQGKYSEAVSEYRKAIAKRPNTLNLHYRLARALLMESHSPEALEAARKEFEAELRLNPNDAVAEYQVAQILLAQQKRAEAIERLERAVELAPDFSEALIALGRERSRDLRYGDAIELLEKAVSLTPKSESARYALMTAYRNAGRDEEARREQARLKELRRASGGEFEQFLERIGETGADSEP